MSWPAASGPVNGVPAAPAIISPPRRRQGDSIGELVIMTATHPDLTALRRRQDFAAEKGEPLFLSRFYQGAPPLTAYGLAGPFMGAPLAAMLMETLAAWGARRFVFLGWCGALAPSLRNGDIVVPCGAFADEGTTRAYGCDQDRIAPASPDFQTELNTHLIQSGIDCQDALVWTTDAVFRETEDKVRHYRDLGARAVEMELSALYSVGRHLDVELGAILVVSDELSTFKWQPGFKTDRFKSARAAVCEAIAAYVERARP